MPAQTTPSGRLLTAPENFLDAAGVRRVFAEARHGRRDFLRHAFAAAVGVGAAAAPARAASDPQPSGGGDANILELPQHSKGLGRPRRPRTEGVAGRPYAPFVRGKAHSASGGYNFLTRT